MEEVSSENVEHDKKLTFQKPKISAAACAVHICGASGIQDGGGGIGSCGKLQINSRNGIYYGVVLIYTRRI
jgi:hypothetical protein